MESLAPFDLAGVHSLWSYSNLFLLTASGGRISLVFFLTLVHSSGACSWLFRGSFELLQAQISRIFTPVRSSAFSSQSCSHLRGAPPWYLYRYCTQYLRILVSAVSSFRTSAVGGVVFSRTSTLSRLSDSLLLRYSDPSRAPLRSFNSIVRFSVRRLWYCFYVPYLRLFCSSLRTHLLQLLSCYCTPMVDTLLVDSTVFVSVWSAPDNLY